MLQGNQPVQVIRHQHECQTLNTVFIFLKTHCLHDYPPPNQIQEKRSALPSSRREKVYPPLLRITAHAQFFAVGCVFIFLHDYLAGDYPVGAASRPRHCVSPCSSRPGGRSHKQFPQTISTNHSHNPHKPFRCSHQISSNTRPGYSSASLIAAKNSTASRPSMMRWS